MDYPRRTCFFCGFSWDAPSEADVSELCAACTGLELEVLRANNNVDPRKRKKLSEMLTAKWKGKTIHILSDYGGLFRAVILEGPDAGKLVEFPSIELEGSPTYAYRYYIPGSKCFHELSEPEQLAFIKELQDSRYQDKLYYKHSGGDTTPRAPRVKQVKSEGEKLVSKLNAAQLAKLKELLG